MLLQEIYLEGKKSGACRYSAHWEEIRAQTKKDSKPLDFFCHITTAIRSFSSFFSPEQVFLIVTQPGFSGDILSLAVLAMSGELS